MVADTAGIIGDGDRGPTRVVAVSMGAFIAQELMLSRPDLVTQAVLMGTRTRRQDTAAVPDGGTGTAGSRHRAAALRRESPCAGELFA